MIKAESGRGLPASATGDAVLRGRRAPTPSEAESAPDTSASSRLLATPALLAWRCVAIWPVPRWRRMSWHLSARSPGAAIRGPEGRHPVGHLRRVPAAIRGAGREIW
ncbi:MAG: hypothetical protein MZV65_54495 [Chromatiales bacterium]|nr:hypothetical protein [Chromatiales bacterium]